jgi:hypothetical protein
MPSAARAKSEDASRRFLNELIERELSEPVDRFIADRVQPQADAILDRYRAQLADVTARLQALSTGALDAVALFRSAAAQAADQLREDADRELSTAFDFATKIDSTAALESYLVARIQQAFTDASMTAAEEIGPLLARLLPGDPEAETPESAAEQARTRRA